MIEFDMVLSNFPELSGRDRVIFYAHFSILPKAIHVEV